MGVLEMGFFLEGGGLKGVFRKGSFFRGEGVGRGVLEGCFGGIWKGDFRIGVWKGFS